jgi:hypothetical protein
MSHLGIIVLGLGILAWSVRRIVSAQARPKPTAKHMAAGVKAAGGQAAGERGVINLLDELQQTRQPLARHHIYTRLLDAAYRDRHTEASRRLLVDQAGRYLAELEGMLPALKAEMGPEPVILPLKWMAIALEEDGRLAEAIEICRRAEDWKLSDGTKTGFAGRRRRMDRKGQRKG